jgi:hypothetical protein
MRTSDPVRIGVPISRPNSLSLNFRSAAMRTPMMENMVQTAKQTVKAIVDIVSARVAPSSPDVVVRNSALIATLFLVSFGLGCVPRCLPDDL